MNINHSYLKTNEGEGQNSYGFVKKQEEHHHLKMTADNSQKKQLTSPNELNGESKQWELGKGGSEEFIDNKSVMSWKIYFTFAILSLMIGYGYSGLFDNQIDPFTIESELNMTQLVAKYPNYRVSQYTARTRDGYILTIFRLNSITVPVSRKSPVFLMHGVCLSSEEYIRMGPGNSLGYLLADAGYDVWIGNYRGNRYTSHVRLSRNERKFWDYSYDEHGMEDVPAMLNTVLKYNGAERVHYIGFSMGCSGYLIMCHTRPEMRNKIASFIGMAPAATLNTNLAPLASFIFKIRLPKILRSIGLDPIAVPLSIGRSFTNTWCSGRSKINICNEVIGFIVGRDDEQIDREKIGGFYGRLSPLSVKTLEHFLQGILSGRLRKFDFGRQSNQARYGQDFPPLYNVSTNIAPTALFYGKNDLLVPAAVGINVANELAKTNPVVIQKFIAWDKFTHIDFLDAKDLGQLISLEIVQQQIEFSEAFDL